MRSLSPLAAVGQAVGECMNEIARHFKRDAKVTVVVRRPGHPQQDFIMSDDELDEVIACCRRRNGEPGDG